jgi:hypothetical protein
VPPNSRTWPIYAPGGKWFVCCDYIYNGRQRRLVGWGPQPKRHKLITLISVCYRYGWLDQSPHIAESCCYWLTNVGEKRCGLSTVAGRSRAGALGYLYWVTRVAIHSDTHYFPYLIDLLDTRTLCIFSIFLWSTTRLRRADLDSHDTVSHFKSWSTLLMAHFLLLGNFECLSRGLATNSSISGTSERLKATEKSSRLIPTYSSYPNTGVHDCQSTYRGQ